MDFLEPSWSDIETMCENISGEISKEFKPDILIGIIRGGLVPLRIISDFLTNNNVATFRIEYYTGIGEKKEKPEITQPLTIDIKGKKILLIDDVSDSGDSLIEAKKYLESFKPSEIKTATLHYKPESKLKPDFFEETTGAWIIYPWEKKETKKEMRKEE